MSGKRFEKRSSSVEREAVASQGEDLDGGRRCERMLGILKSGVCQGAVVKGKGFELAARVFQGIEELLCTLVCNWHVFHAQLFELEVEGESPNGICTGCRQLVPAQGQVG